MEKIRDLRDVPTTQSSSLPQPPRSSVLTDNRTSALSAISNRLDLLTGEEGADRTSAALYEDFIPMPAKPSASGEYEDSDVEESRRRQWIRYFVAQKRFGDAEDIGWDLESPPDPRPNMPESERRELWIRYFVDSWLFDEAIAVGWDEESPPDPRPRRLFVWNGSIYVGYDVYRDKEKITIHGFMDEATLVNVKITSSLRLEVKMTLQVLSGLKAGETKKVKIRCNTFDNFHFFTKTWAQIKTERQSKQATAPGSVRVSKK